MRAYKRLNAASLFFTGLALLPPLFLSFFVAPFLGGGNRGHDRAMMVCGLCWSPILAPSWGLSWALGKLAKRYKPADLADE